MQYKSGLPGNDFDDIEEDVFYLFEDLGLTKYPAMPFVLKVNPKSPDGLFVKRC